MFRFEARPLLVSNHVSFIDGFFVGACVQRFVRFLVYRPYYEQQPFHWVLRKMNAIPIQGGDPEKVAESIELARAQLRQGHVVCIFAEGSVSRTGGMLPFKHGFQRIMEGLDVPIIPVNLDRVWGSVFSFKDGRPFFRRPEHFPYPVTVSFGAPLLSSANAQQVRQAVLELGSEAAPLRRSGRDQLHLRFIRTAKRGWFRFAVADSHRRLTYGSVLVESLLLARRLRKAAGHDGPAPRRMVGLLLPPSAEAVLANLAVLFAGWIPVNLPRDASPDQLSEIVKRCGIHTVIGSRRAPIEPGITFEEALSMEELASRRSRLGRAIAAAIVFLLPARLLQAVCQREEDTPDSLATVVHTAGVSGAPKSVMLSHYNIVSNVEAFEQIFWVNRQDRVAGSLPFHHALGLTATLWFPLLAGCGVLYHDDPADASGMGQLAGRYGGTIFVARPVQYSAYLSDVPPQDFRMVRSALVGGSVTEPDLARRFQEKFGVELIEGYGLAEMTAVVAVNVPDYEHGRRNKWAASWARSDIPSRASAPRSSTIQRAKHCRPIKRDCCLSRAPAACWATSMGASGRPLRWVTAGWKPATELSWTVTASSESSPRDPINNPAGGRSITISPAHLLPFGLPFRGPSTPIAGWRICG